MILYTNASARVRFVSMGMAIVSPLGFKQFVRECSIPGNLDRAVLTVQDEVLKAGWYVPAEPGGQNIHRFVGRARSGLTAEPEALFQPAARSTAEGHDVMACRIAAPGTSPRMAQSAGGHCCAPWRTHSNSMRLARGRTR